MPKSPFSLWFQVFYEILSIQMISLVVHGTIYDYHGMYASMWGWDVEAQSLFLEMRIAKSEKVLFASDSCWQTEPGNMMRDGFR